MSEKDPFKELFANVKRMGAAIRPFLVNDHGPGEWKDLTAELEAGIEIDIHDLDSASDYGGLLSYKGRQVLLYIPDHSFKFDEAVVDASRANRYHVADCSTLQNMRRDNRIERYTATTNRDRKFEIFGDKRSNRRMKASVELHICKNCLGKTNYKGYSTNGYSNKAEVFSSFDRDEFFKTYFSLFPFSTQPLERMTSGYPDNWKEISRSYRISRNHICEDCKVNLANKPQLLHTHHINGVKSEVREFNLRALCVDCHRRQKFHGHMKISASEIAMIRDQRRKDGIDVPQTWDRAMMLADPAFHGLLHKLKQQGKKIPRVAYQFIGRDREFEFEICWPEQKLVVEKNGGSKSAIELEGWRVRKLAELL